MNASTFRAIIRRSGFFGPILLACVLAPVATSAQVHGRTVDAFNEPLPDVHVELWGIRGRIATTRTNANGDFYFAPEAAVESTGIVARRLGFRPLSMAFDARRGGRVYVMERLATALPTVVSTASRRACPNVEDPDARATWTAVRARYYHPPYSYSWWVVAVADSGFVNPRDVGQVDEARLTATGIGIGGAQRLADSGRIADSGYAYRTYQTIQGRVRPGWAYARLGSWMAQHFLDPLFAVRNSFSWAAQSHSGERSAIVFCPKTRRLPSISGTLQLGADGTLASASWIFHTPSPNESAGGTVTLAPLAYEGPRLLLPAFSVIWRRGTGANRDSFYQVATRFERLHLNYDRVSPKPSDPVLNPERPVRPGRD